MATENTKLYSEEEIGAILKRTAELSEGRESDSRSGLSLDELKQLAAEAGLDPDHVVRAVVELTGSRPLNWLEMSLVVH